MTDTSKKLQILLKDKSAGQLVAQDEKNSSEQTPIADFYEKTSLLTQLLISKKMPWNRLEIDSASSAQGSSNDQDNTLTDCKDKESS